MTSAKISDFFYPLTPLVSKFTQPPLLRLLTMSAFEGTPLPPQCGHHVWMPPYDAVGRRQNLRKQTA